MMHSSGVPSMAYYSYSNQNSPAMETADQEFQFPSVTLPPRLKNIGRKISQMSNDFLPPNVNVPDDDDSKSLSRSPSTSRKEIEVPGMGDEPVMCPFCNKPLPPSLLASQLTSGKGEHAHSHNKQPPASLRRTPSTRQGTPTQSPSAPLSRVTSSTAPTPGSSTSLPHRPEPVHTQALHDALPVNSPGAVQQVESALPSATSESFAETVKEGDLANHTAAEKFITDDEIKRWSSLSGVAVASSAKEKEETKTAPVKEDIKEEKAFPLIPPPPGPSKLTKPSPSQTPPITRPSSSASASARSSKFNFFGRGSQQGNDEDEDSDDDAVGASGYSKLTAPGSPTDSEGEEGLRLKIDRYKEGVNEEKKEQSAEIKRDEEVKEEPSLDTSTSTPEADAVVPPVVPVPDEKAEVKDDGLKTVIQEVLGRVNEMSQSHNALLASHSTLLTSLKIARSNLAMAEANSEMLEAQLKRASATPASTRGPGSASRNVSSPASTPGTSQQPQSLAPRSSADHPRASTPASAVGSNPAPAPRAPARASTEDRPRPLSLQVTASDLAGAGSSTSPSSAVDSNKPWGFWNGGKKKVTGALNQMHVPSPAQMIAALPQSRPGTPGGERTSSEYPWSPSSPVAPYASLSAIEAPRAIVRPTPVSHSNISRSLNQQPSLARSMSTTNVPSQRSTSSGLPPVTSQELATLRQAYSSAVAKMDGMSKELAELKKGKIEMEAELENLSQALFEEANKMVADERRKRAEMEENLKEVREEREALRQTIKVLGGKVEDEEEKEQEVKDDEEEAQGVEEVEDTFMPRDLDKHYEALSKAIHHVASGTDLTEQEQDEVKPGGTSIPVPLVAEPTPLSPIVGEAVGLEIPSRSTTIDSTSSGPAHGRGISMSLPAESNPWASSSPPRISVKAATPSPHPELAELPEDTAGEGEAPSGLGLEMDKGAVKDDEGGEGGESAAKEAEKTDEVREQ